MNWYCMESPDGDKSCVQQSGIAEMQALGWVVVSGSYNSQNECLENCAGGLSVKNVVSEPTPAWYCIKEPEA